MKTCRRREDATRTHQQSTQNSKNNKCALSTSLKNHVQAHQKGQGPAKPAATNINRLGFSSISKLSDSALLYIIVTISHTQLHPEPEPASEWRAAGRPRPAPGRPSYPREVGNPQRSVRAARRTAGRPSRRAAGGEDGEPPWLHKY